jgi:hypothetical protein
MQDGGQKLIEYSQIGRRPVSGHLHRPLTLFECLSEN